MKMNLKVLLIASYLKKLRRVLYIIKRCVNYVENVVFWINSLFISLTY